MAVEVLDDNLMVCSDCMQMIANGDVSGLDYHYTEKQAARRLVEINEGMAAQGGQVVCGDVDNFDEFSGRPCGCCGDNLAGARHHCVVLGTVKEPVFHAENKGKICCMRETALGVEALRIDDWYWKAYTGCFTQL
jgi:hypothetical protein